MENHDFSALVSSIQPISGRKDLKRSLTDDAENENAKKSKNFESVRKLKSKKLQGLPLEVAEALRIKTNEQERERQRVMNTAYDNLRLLRMPYNPNLPGHKEDSKFYLLKTATDYIHAMMTMIREHDSRQAGANGSFAAPGVGLGPMHVQPNMNSPQVGFGPMDPYHPQPQHPGLPAPRFPMNDTTNFQQAYCIQPLPGQGQYASPNDAFQNPGQFPGHTQPTTPVCGTNWTSVLRPPGDLSCKRLAPSKTPHLPQRAATSHPLVATPTRPTAPMPVGRPLHHFSPIMPVRSPMPGHGFRSPQPSPSVVQYNSTPVSGHQFAEGPFELTTQDHDLSLTQGQCYLQQFMPPESYVPSNVNTPTTSNFCNNNSTAYQYSDNNPTFDSGHFSSSNISDNLGFSWTDAANGNSNGHFNPDHTTAHTPYPGYQQNFNTDNFLTQLNDASGQDSGQFSFDWLLYTDDSDNQIANANTISLSSFPTSN